MEFIIFFVADQYFQKMLLAFILHLKKVSEKYFYKDEKKL